MKHKHRRKGVRRRFKHLAAAMAGAAILSSALLPGIPSATAHASPVSTTDGPTAVNAHQTISSAEMMNESTMSNRITPLPTPTTPPNTIVNTAITGLEGMTPNNLSDNKPAAPLAAAARNLHAMERGIKAPLPPTDEPASAAQTANTAPVQQPTAAPVETQTAPEVQPPAPAPAPTAQTPAEEPVAQAVTVSNKTAPTTPVGTNAPKEYKQVISVKATAYAPGPHDNGQWGNLTHIGTQVRPGIIAVDPKVIPLGSKVYIEYPDGTGAYAVAEDTGGAIKGNRIDVAKWTVGEAYKFGIQSAKVYVLHTPENI